MGDAMTSAESGTAGSGRRASTGSAAAPATPLGSASLGARR